MGVVTGGTGGIFNRSEFLELFRKRLEEEAAKEIRSVRVLADADEPHAVDFEIRWVSLEAAKNNMVLVRSILSEPELVGSGEVNLRILTSRLE